MTVSELASRAGGSVVDGPSDRVVASFAFDSRAIEPDACFVALRGHRDGHDFVGHAFGSGAAAALVARPVHDRPDGAAVVLVDDTIGALARAASTVRDDHEHLAVVGVTGSTGKTSTKDLLHAALHLDRRVHANEESYNNEFGLPLTILNMPEHTEVLVTEMGERRPGDVAALCAVARPTVGVVTNVGLAHAEHLGGPDGVAAAMAELVEALPPDGLAVLNADDERTPWLATRTPARVLTVGYGAGADHRVEDVHVDEHLRTSFALRGVEFEIPLRGAHQVHNAAMAVVVAGHLGVPLADVALALSRARGQRWRMELEESPAGVTVLNDAYNANPTSTEAALRALVHLRTAGRRIAVLGDMRELGEHHDDAHHAAGRLAAELGVDVVVGVGDGGRLVAEAARAGGVADVVAVPDAAAASEAVTTIVAAGDAVLVKASRALGLEHVAEALLRAPVVATGSGTS